MKGLDFSSPKDLGTAMATILQPKSSEKIYDGAFGSLNFLLSIKEYIDKHESLKNSSNSFYGREINRTLFEQAVENIDDLDTGNFRNEDTLEKSSESVETYDVIISCPPFGLRTDNSLGELGITTKDATNKFLQHYINSLKDGGRAAIVVSNSFFWSLSHSAIALRKILLTNCNLHTVLGLPSKTFSYTSISTSVLFFTKGQETTNIKYYAKDLSENYSSFIDFAVDNIENERSFIHSFSHGNNDDFNLPDANKLVIQKEIKEKTKNFRTFNLFKVEDACLEVNLTKQTFKEKENCIYLPRIGKSQAVTNIDKTTLKHQNYFQLVLDKEKILNGYINYYFKSSLGKMILESCYTGSTIPNITKKSLNDSLEIHAPDIEKQELIAKTFETLSEVTTLMEDTALQFSSTPNSAEYLLEKLLQTKEVFNKLSFEEQILRLIRSGENLKVEFKETLSKNTHTGKKDKNLQLSVLKNIVGFLNKSGGELLIGVSDDGQIKGIEEDYYKSDDDYKLLLSNLINDNIGVKESKYIKFNIYTVRTKKVCLVKCKKSIEPAYLGGDFYIRTDPECRKLTSQETQEYIRANF